MYPKYNFKCCVVFLTATQLVLFCVVFFISATPSKHKIFVLCLHNVLPNICEMLLKIFSNMKTFGLKIITVTFLIIFELLFSQRLEIHLYNIAKIIHRIFLYIIIERHFLILKLLA